MCFDLLKLFFNIIIQCWVVINQIVVVVYIVDMVYVWLEFVVCYGWYWVGCCGVVIVVVLVVIINVSQGMRCIVQWVVCCILFVVFYFSDFFVNVNYGFYKVI